MVKYWKLNTLNLFVLNNKYEQITIKNKNHKIIETICIQQPTKFINVIYLNGNILHKLVILYVNRLTLKLEIHKYCKW